MHGVQGCFSVTFFFFKYESSLPYQIHVSATAAVLRTDKIIAETFKVHCLLLNVINY